MFCRTIIALLVCVMPLASCGNPAEVKLPVPPDEDAFQFDWNKTGGHCCLDKIPRDLNGWTGRVLVKKTAPTGGGHRVELFVVEIAKNIAVVSYGNDDPKVRSDIPEAGWYVKFDAVTADLPWSSASELQMLGKDRLVLVEIKLKSVMAPGDPRHGGYG